MGQNRLLCGGQFPKPRQPGGGSAQGSSHVEQVSHPCSRPQQCSSTRNRAHQHNICNGNGRLSQVSASQRDFVYLRQSQQAVVESRDPGRPASRCHRQLARQTQRKKCRHRPCSHRCQVAHAARQGPVANRLRRVPVQPEVAAGNRQIRGNRQLFAAPRSNQGAVVADAQAQTARCRPRRSAANLAQQGKFTPLGGVSKFRKLVCHTLRIGQTAQQRTQKGRESE